MGFSDHRKLSALLLLVASLLLIDVYYRAKSVDESYFDPINEKYSTRNNLRNIQSIAESTHAPVTANKPEPEPSLWKHGQRIQTHVDQLVRQGDVDGLCVAIDRYVHDRSERLPIPEVQLLSASVNIPTTTVAPATTESEMVRRRHLAERGCKIKSIYAQLRKTYWNQQDVLFQKLRDLQAYVMSDGNIRDSLDRPFLLPVTGQQLRTIFFLEKYKIMSCLPLKTGTTNWQRSLISLLYVDDSGTPRLDPNDVVKENIYKELPRYSARYNQFLFKRSGIDQTKLPCLRKALRKRVDDDSYTKWMNVRHPMSRLLSAWNQKFKNDYDGLDIYLPYVKPIRKYEDIAFDETENGHKVSLAAFLAYLGEVATDDKYNEHWKSYWNTCSPCSMNYQFITKQETSAADATFILEKNDIQHLTYLPGQYSDSLVKEKRAEDYFVGVDEATIKTIYNIYFMDFVMFNYTIDEYLKWKKFAWL